MFSPKQTIDLTTLFYHFFVSTPSLTIFFVKTPNFQKSLENGAFVEEVLDGKKKERPECVYLYGRTHIYTIYMDVNLLLYMP